MRIFLAVILVAAFAASALAATVDHNAPDGVAARIIEGGGAAIFVTTDGRAFAIDFAAPVGEWEEVTPTWPVPFEQIAEVSLYFAVASDGTAWGHSYPWNSTMDWNLLPPLPATPVPTDDSSMGDVKSLFR